MFFKKLKNEENYLEFKNIINDIRLNEKVKEMNNYMQHSSTSCYNHCLHVAYYTYLICKKFGLDYFSASRAAMLHDFFLYDWHDHRKVNSFRELHAFSHPKIALENSLKNFTLNDLEKDVIVKLYRISKDEIEYILETPNHKKGTPRPSRGFFICACKALLPAAP